MERRLRLPSHALRMLAGDESREPILLVTGSTWKPNDVDDIIFYGALGAIIGGRLGWVLFYGFAMQQTGLAQRVAFHILGLFPPTYPGIPILVERIILEGTGGEVDINTTIMIDLEGVPLKTTLRLCLKQLGLAYRVQDGLLRIAPEVDLSKEPQNPIRVAGHCLLALIAAAFGLLAGLLVSAARTTSAGRE